MKAAVFGFLAVVGLIAAVRVASVDAKTLWHQLDNYSFDDYMKEYNKVYDCQEHLDMRRQIFEDNLAQIKKHNADPTKSWKEGVNHLTDLTEKEFRAMLGYDKVAAYSMRKQTLGLARPAPLLKDLPSSVDWRKSGLVSDVKDQGQCGSCWTFAATETIESHYAKKTGQLHVLSEQNILDCVPNPDQCGGTGGCSGGTAELAYIGLTDQGGISSEWTYPYTSYFGASESCKSRGKVVRLGGYHKLAENSYNDLMNSIATIGPMAVTVEAIRWSRYESGVFDGCNQTNPDLDHAVQLVGYGTDSATGLDYWLVRNSWSPAWGELGYIRVVRTNSEETRCGSDITPGDGTACKNSTGPQHVCGSCGILFDSCYPILG